MVYQLGKKPVKIIAVSSRNHPLHRFIEKLCKAISEEAKVPYEIKLEDYVFLTEHGAKDEFGYTFLPQIFIKYDDGKIELILSEIPLNEKLKPDLEKAKKAILEKLVR